MVAAIIGGIGSIAGLASKFFGGGGGGGNSAYQAYIAAGEAAARRYNEQQQRNYEEAVEYARKVAAIQNDYNFRAFAADVGNYLDQADYQWNLSVADWKNKVTIQDYEYLQKQKLFQKSLGITTSQLQLNDLAQDNAFAFEDFNLTQLMKAAMFTQESELMGVQRAIVENQQNKKATELSLANIDLQRGELGIQRGELGIQSAAIGLKKKGLAQEAEFIGKEELLIDQQNAIAKQFVQEQLETTKREAAFKQQGAYVETLNKQGQALTRQAGKSRGKAEQVILGEFFRGMSQLESTLTGQSRQVALKFKELQSQTNFDKAKLQLKRDQLGLQAAGYSLDQANLALQGRALDIASGKLDIQAQGIGLQQQKYDTALQNEISDAQFNFKILDAEIMKAATQATLNKKNISITKFGSDLNAVANLMIEPSKLPYSPAPIAMPEQTFTKPAQVLPAFVAKPIDQTFVPTPQQGGGGGVSNTLSLVGEGLSMAAGLYTAGSSIFKGGSQTFSSIKGNIPGYSSGDIATNYSSASGLGSYNFNSSVNFSSPNYSIKSN